MTASTGLQYADASKMPNGTKKQNMYASRRSAIVYEKDMSVALVRSSMPAAETFSSRVRAIRGESRPAPPAPAMSALNRANRQLNRLRLEANAARSSGDR
jgi:hypothetical protein